VQAKRIVPKRTGASKKPDAVAFQDSVCPSRKIEMKNSVVLAALIAAAAPAADAAKAAADAAATAATGASAAK